MSPRPKGTLCRGSGANDQAVIGMRAKMMFPKSNIVLNSKARELSFYVLCHPPAVQEQIGVIFWPDASPIQPRRSLSLTLRHLRWTLDWSHPILSDKWLAKAVAMVELLIERQYRWRRRRATALWIYPIQDKLWVEITDDGVGLNRNNKAKQPTGVGLLSMQERAAELGGRCAIEPGPVGGTPARA